MIGSIIAGQAVAKISETAYRTMIGGIQSSKDQVDSKIRELSDLKGQIPSFWTGPQAAHTAELMENTIAKLNKQSRNMQKQITALEKVLTIMNRVFNNAGDKVKGVARWVSSITGRE